MAHAGNGCTRNRTGNDVSDRTDADDATPQPSRPVDAEQVRQMYEELRRIARRERRRLPSATLNTTALVHEAWLRMSPEDTPYESRRHFLGTAAVAMRRLVVDYARSRAALKRGGDVVHVELGDPGENHAVSLDRILDIDRVLDELQKVDPGLPRLVELRFFGGLTCEEAADVLEISPRTAARDWSRARALLKVALAGH